MDAKQLSHELNIKAMTAVSSLLSDYERGLISKAQVATGCRAVFDTVGGLVSSEIIDLVSQAAAEYKHANGVEVHFIKYKGQIRGAMHVCGTDKVLEFVAAPLAVAHMGSDEPAVNASWAAKDAVQALRNDLEMQG